MKTATGTIGCWSCGVSLDDIALGDDSHDPHCTDLCGPSDVDPWDDAADRERDEFEAA